MTYKTRRERRAKGGKATETEPLHPEHGNQYNAQGSPEAKEETAKPDGFRRGGKAKRKAGGHVEGHEARKHLGRRARGGHVAHVDVHMEPHHEHGGHDGQHHGPHHDAAKHDGEHHHKPHRARGGRAGHGGTPFSSANKTMPPGNEKDGPGEQAPMIP